MTDDEEYTPEQFDQMWAEAEPVETTGWSDLKPYDTCCACYGCPDHGHDCGLPPLQAAMRRAYYTHNREKAIRLILKQGLAAPCGECGTLYDTSMVTGPNCVEHGGELTPKIGDGGPHIR